MAGTPRVSLVDILITAELARRPTPLPDYETESRALRALADYAGPPQAILQRLAETALDVCRAGSAGVSILDPATGEFRWRATTGLFAPYVGRRMSRAASPCGMVLDRNTPLLFANPERYFDYGPLILSPIVEALIVPFIAGEKAIGTLWVIAHMPSCQFDSEHQRLLASL